MRVDSVFARLVYTESQKFDFKSFAFNAISAVVGALGALGLAGNSPYAQARKDEIRKRPTFSGRREDYPEWRHEFRRWMSNCPAHERQSEASYILQCLPTAKA